MPDPFDQFAADRGLRLTAERLGMAPRDVIAPLEDVEQHYVVTLSNPATGTSFRTIFATPLTDPAPPAVRDVLWWTASDAWMLEQTQRTIEQWAPMYGYPASEGATARLFQQHVEQADALEALLGEFHYRRLLSLYESETAPTRLNRRPVLR